MPDTPERADPPETAQDHGAREQPAEPQVPLTIKLPPSAITFGDGTAVISIAASLGDLIEKARRTGRDEVLETIQLSDDVMQALLERGGRYGPYLALAEACELNSALVSSLASSLNLTPHDVNKAHLLALAWAQNVAAE